MRALIRFAAVAYPAALLVLILALRFIGERWWLTTVALYLPRHWFAPPLPVLTIAILVIAERRLLVTQAIAAWLLLVPLMGFEAPGWRPAGSGPGAVRVLSMNVDQNRRGSEAILARIQATDPAIVVLQEFGPAEAAAYATGLAEYERRGDGEFYLASRYPIEDVFVPARNPRERKVFPFVRYRLALPSGPVAVYNIHPHSPRDALEELRGQGSIAAALTSPKLWRLTALPEINSNTRLRMRQLQVIAEDVRRSPYPVIVAGDSNLPGLSWALTRWFGGLQDGFERSGSGFGYTYPIGKRGPWLRIDRVLAGPQFDFVDFSVIDTGASDHRAVLAALQFRAADAGP